MDLSIANTGLRSQFSELFVHSRCISGLLSGFRYGKLKNMKRSKLDIFTYLDFRRYLSERLAELKAENAKYSLRYLSDRLGLKSKSHLKMVADGQRNLSPKLAASLADVLGLSADETAFFKALVLANQARTPADQSAALDELRRKRRFKKLHRLDLDRFDYLADPLLLTLREMTTFPDFQDDPAWIATRLPGRVGKRRIEKGLMQLERAGLLVRRDDNRLEAAHKHQHTGDGLHSAALKTFYANTFKAAELSMRQPADVRQLAGLTMAISRPAYDRILERLTVFIDDVRAIADADAGSNEVYQLALALFPLTRPGVGEAEDDGSKGGNDGTE